MTNVVRYTTKELRALRRYDVKPARAARKVIVGYRLWRPLETAQRCSNTLDKTGLIEMPPKVIYSKRLTISTGITPGNRYRERHSMYADDVILISSSTRELQKMISVCNV